MTEKLKNDEKPKKFSNELKKRLNDELGLVFIRKSTKGESGNAENKEETTEEPTER